jgi:hypothetical protein
MAPLIAEKNITPDSRWYELEHLCQKEKTEIRNEMYVGHGGPGYYRCPVGTLRIGDIDCSPCQVIAYTCPDTGQTVLKETFCPVGAPYPDDRNLPGEPSSGYCKSNRETSPKKTCLQIKNETIRKLSLLWKRNCTIQTNGYMKDLLEEAGTHCGVIKSVCPRKEGTPVPKEQRICVNTMGTWEAAMRHYLLDLSPACTVEGTGRTQKWWDYYQAVLQKKASEQVYPSLMVTTSVDEDTRIDIEELVKGYQYQPKGWSMRFRAPDFWRAAKTLFFLNDSVTVLPTDIATLSMRQNLKKLCLRVRVQGDFAEGERSSSQDKWADAAMALAESTLICPLK